MTRYFVDCREVPSEMNCTVSIAADDPDELVEAAEQHMVSVHQHDPGSDLQNEIRDTMHEGEQAM